MILQRRYIFQNLNNTTTFSLSLQNVWENRPELNINIQVFTYLDPPKELQFSRYTAIVPCSVYGSPTIFRESIFTIRSHMKKQLVKRVLLYEKHANDRKKTIVMMNNNFWTAWLSNTRASLVALWLGGHRVRSLSASVVNTAYISTLQTLLGESLMR